MKKIVYLLGLIVVLSGCSNDRSNGPVPGLLKQMTATGFTGVFHYKYAYDGYKLSFVVHEGGYEKVKYTGDLIVQADQYDNSDNLIGRQTFQYDGSGRVISSLTLDYALTLGYKQQVVYNPDGSVAVTVYGGDLSNQSTLLRTNTHQFLGGEISNTVTTQGGNQSVMSYTYDAEPSAIGTIPGLDKLAVIDIDFKSLAPDFLKGMHQNLNLTLIYLNSVLTGTVHYVSEYGPNGYPVSMFPALNTTTVSDVTRYDFIYY